MAIADTSCPSKQPSLCHPIMSIELTSCSECENDSVMNHALRTSSTNFAAHWGAGRTIPDSDTMYSNARPHEDNARNDAEAVRSSVPSFFFSQARSTDTRKVRGRTRSHGRPEKNWHIRLEGRARGTDVELRLKPPSSSSLRCSTLVV